MEMEISEKKIYTESAISFLNDFRLAIVRFPGDIGFKVKRNPNNPKLEQYATKYVHSTILFARSKWFRKVYPLYKKTDDMNVFEENNEALNEIKVKVTPQLDNQGHLVFQIDGVSLDSFQELSKFNLKFINNLIKIIIFLVHFLYSAQAKVTDDNIEYLLKLSEVFKIRSLQAMLENHFINRLKNKLDVKTALHYLQLAARNLLDNLRHECYSVLRQNKDILVHTSAWNELLDRKPSLLLDVFDEEKEKEDEINE